MRRLALGVSTSSREGLLRIGVVIAVGTVVLSLGQRAYARWTSPRVELSTNSIDLGTVRKGERIQARVIVRNRGRNPLVIEAVRSPCNCTVSSGSGEIAPGVEREVFVDIETASQDDSRDLLAVVAFATNDPRNPSMTFRVRARVIPEISFEPKTVDFGTTPRGVQEKRSAMLSLTALGTSIRVLSAVSTDKAVDVRLEEISSRQTRLSATIAPGAQPGRHSGAIVVRTTSAILPEFRIGVAGEIRPSKSN